MKKDVVILTGAGQIGMTIACRVSQGKKLVIGDKRLENAVAIAKTRNEVGEGMGERLHPANLIYKSGVFPLFHF